MDGTRKLVGGHVTPQDPDDRARSGVAFGPTAAVNPG